LTGLFDNSAGELEESFNKIRHVQSLVLTSIFRPFKPVLWRAASI